MNMKNNILLLSTMSVVLGLCGPRALASDPMGPPMANLERGQFSIGPEYAFGDMDLKLDGEGGLPNIEHPDVQVHKVYANLGYGVCNIWDVFLRFGLSRLEGTDEIGSVDQMEGGGSTEFAWGFGTKATFFECHCLTLGGLFQIALPINLRIEIPVAIGLT